MVDLDFSKSKTREDVEKVFNENKRTLDTVKNNLKKLIED